MITNENLHKLADFVLLNACSVSSTGLYNGKAGMSLCLFEVARTICDEYLEDSAFELLQESLLSNNKDISFENGLSGIGYVLQYLIDNKFIEADFDEMFGEQTEKVLVSLEKPEYSTHILQNSLKIIYFLSDVNRSKNNKRIENQIQSIFNSVEHFLITQFDDFKQPDNKSNKLMVLNFFEEYLRLVAYSDYKNFSMSIIENYSTMYRQDRIASNFHIGYYLQEVCINNSISGYDDVIDSNKQNSLQNIHIESLSLRQRTDIYNLLKFSKDIDQKIILGFESAIFGKQGTEFEKEILDSIAPKNHLAGYGEGVARFLMISSNHKSSLN